ncbi:hypothetical protein BN1012_Phect796 [Candidatus Phaeomarinobacter ectocarpi]|uniref:Translocation and assembly module TamB C-terminal domain-containing protein n=1 Tax=Candidatus Phaeomarinibacter ectocarpi TaxID=1458461 RepID=X5MKY8_9HYPH|nr:translocation/assembly module TamB domain-containing protein [Candidatus Phaeomarinobacter ectocarpi]CDO59010.1 hypothetical protein BN1012_Phect796 [Candidatus Phaeomarinobacter ectocarpi]
MPSFLDDVDWVRVRALGAKLLRFGLIGAGSLVALAVVVALVAFVVLQITPVREAIGARVIALLGEGDGLTIEIDGYDGIWPVQLGIEKLAVRDGGLLVLEAHDVDVSWSPWALLSGTAHVRNFQVARIDVLALPQGEDETDEPPGPLIPSLPVDVQIDAIDVPELTLAAGIAGDEPVALMMRGHLVLADGNAQTDLKVMRTDGGNFDLAVTADIAPAAQRFDLDLTLTDGAAGAPGLIASITDNDDLAQVTARATASGPVEAWDGRLAAQVGRMGTLDLTVLGDRRPGEAVDVALSFTPGSALQDLPPKLEVTAAVTGDEDDVYATDNLRVVAGDASFAGKATLTDPLDAPRLTLAGDAVNISALAGVQLPDIIRVVGDAAADASMTQIDIAALTVEADGLAASFEGQLDLDAGRASGLARLTTQDIAPWAALGDVDAAGALTARADIDTFWFDGRMDGDLTAEFMPVRLPVDGLVQAIGASLIVDGRFAAASPGDGTRIDALSLAPASGLFALDVRGTASADRLGLETNFSTQDLSRFSKLADTPLAGAASLSATLAGPTDQLSMDVALELREAQVSGVAADGVGQADLLVSSLPQGTTTVTGPVTFEGKLAGSNASVAATLASVDGATVIEDITAALLGMTVTGTASLQAGGEITADLDGAIKSLGPLGRVAGTPLGGSGTFTLNSTPGDRGNQMSAVVTLRQVNAAGVEAQLLRLRAALAPEGGVSAKVTLQRLAAGNLSAASGVVDVSGRVDRLGVAATLDGISTFDDQKGIGTLTAEAVYDGTQPAVTLSSLKGIVARTPVALEAPVNVPLNGQLRVEDLALALGNGRVAVDVMQRPGALSATARAQNVPLGLLIALTGQTTEAGGTLSGDVTIAGQGRTGNGKADITIAPVTLSSLVGADVSEIPEFTLNADWDGRLATARLTADMPGTEDLIATASLPVTARGGTPYVAPKAQLEARLNGTLDVGAVWPLMPVDGHLMAGLLKLDMTAQGPFADMDITGTARMEGGLYEGFETGVVLSPLNVSLETQGGEADVTVFARDGSTGTLAGEGSFDLRDTATDRLRVDLDMTSFRALGRDDLTALASGDIKVRWARGVEGAVEPLTIGGDVTVERLEARIPDQLASDVETIDVTRVSADGEPIDPEVDQNASNDDAPIELALNVAVPNSAFVRGRGLESEWSGRLAVAGAVTAPELRGGFQVERGTFDFLGQTFDLSGGRIEFTGGRDIDPYLDVKAVYEDDGFTAIVSLTGLSSDPTLVVTSEPLLPQEEILARILFGTSTGQLSAIQAVQLANAAATLSGASSGSGVLETMRRALGVDVLSVGDDGVEVGSYVRDGVYVGVSQGLEAGSGEVSVEVELTDEVSIESGVGTTGDTGVGVTWERDY